MARSAAEGYLFKFLVEIVNDEQIIKKLYDI